MDENHTHFILVDDGTDDKWQTEIELRALLESKLREGSENHHKDNGTILQIQYNSLGSFQIFPDAVDVDVDVVVVVVDVNVDGDACEADSGKVMCVCVAVDGGSGTLKTIMDLIEKDTPAVLVEGMGRVTDLLAFAYKNSRPHPCQIIPDAGEPTFDILHPELDLRRYGSAIVVPHGHCY